MKKHHIILLLFGITSCTLHSGKKWYQIDFTSKNIEYRYFYHTNNLEHAYLQQITILTQLLEKARKQNDSLLANEIRESNQQVSLVTDHKQLEELAIFKKN